MFKVARLTAQLRADEGYRSSVYLCPARVWSIGYGATRLRGEPVTQDTPPISLEEARLQLKADALDAIESCQVIYGPQFELLPPVHQEILICLAYQLGGVGLSRFVKMNKAIAEYDREGWKRELQDSKLFRQATKRIQRYLVAIDEGRWPDR